MKTSENMFSVRDFARRGFDQYAESMKGRENIKADIIFYNRHFRLLSVDGSLVSFEDRRDSSSRLTKLPSGDFLSKTVEVESRFLTIDLTKSGELNYSVEDGIPTSEIDLTNPGEAAILTDYFSGQNILQALLKDTVIKQALSKAKITKQPADLTELLASLEEQDLIADNCIFYLPDDFLTRFAFHHIENDKIAVRLSLQPTTLACRGQKAQLGLLLPIPASLKEPFALADSMRQGFLMKQQTTKFTSEQETYVGFDDNDVH